MNEIRCVKRKQHHPESRSKVASRAPKVEETISEQSSRFRVHPAMIDQWKLALLEGEPGAYKRVRREVAEVDGEYVNGLN